MTSSIDNETSEYMTEISSDDLYLNASLSALDSVEESLLSKVLCEGSSECTTLGERKRNIGI